MIDAKELIDRTGSLQVRYFEDDQRPYVALQDVCELINNQPQVGVKLQFPTIAELAREIADEALDNFEYNGKTIRQWIDEIIRHENGGWIPVRKELPKELGRYIVTLRDGRSLEGLFNSGIKKFVMFDNVIAWQPFPEPYKESED